MCRRTRFDRLLEPRQTTATNLSIPSYFSSGHKNIVAVIIIQQDQHQHRNLSLTLDRSNYGG